MTDERIKTLARNLTHYSCEVKAGENVLVESFDGNEELVRALVREIHAAGGRPFVWMRDNRVQRELLIASDERTNKLLAKSDGAFMEQMQAYIGIRGGNNAYELSDVDAEQMSLYNRIYSLPVHHERRVKNTKWVVLRYPTPGMSQMCGMSTEAFEDFYFEVCNFDYGRMDEAMTPLCELMDRTDEVRILAPGTDLTFSIKGIPSVKCSGKRNIPDGEVYTAPVRDSVNGVISYNVPTSRNGMSFENIVLTFEKGKIVKASGSDSAALNRILDTDKGARYVGEFALGVNPYINKPMGDILFDEKIAGSLHFTPGSCYDEANNGNVSAIHWDLVLIQTEERGGGEIYFDHKLIRKNGYFVPEELAGLNPDRLK